MTHQEIMELLPWYANATLDENERLEVERHLADCRECAREVEQLKLVQAAMTELGEELPAPSPSSIEKALAQIEDYERTREQRPGWFERLRERLGAPLTSWWAPVPAFARVVIVAQLVLILGLGGLFLLRQDAGEKFTTLTGPEIRTEGARLTVGFRPGTTEEAMRQVLRDIQGTIVSGPSALGLYTVAVPVPVERKAELEALLERLLQKEDVIQFAELQP